MNAAGDIVCDGEDDRSVSERSWLSVEDDVVTDELVAVVGLGIVVDDGGDPLVAGCPFGTTFLGKVGLWEVSV